MLKPLIRLYLWFKGLSFTETTKAPSGPVFRTLTTVSDQNLTLYFDFRKEQYTLRTYRRGKIIVHSEERYTVTARHTGEFPATLLLHAPATLRIAGKQIPFLGDELSGHILTEIYLELMKARMSGEKLD